MSLSEWRGWGKRLCLGMFEDHRVGHPRSYGVNSSGDGRSRSVWHILGIGARDLRRSENKNCGGNEVDCCCTLVRVNRKWYNDRR